MNADLSVGEHRNVFVVGDMMNLDKLPGVAQVAIQSGEYAAKAIKAGVEENQEPDQREAFEYFDKGSMAIVGRFHAVVKMGKVEIAGFLGWIMWLLVHVSFLVSKRNRVVSMFTWTLNALTPKRYNLPTTLQQMHARTALLNLGKVTDNDTEKFSELRDTNGEN